MCANVINRPIVVTFIGWGGIVLGLINLIGIFFKLPFLDWNANSLQNPLLQPYLGFIFTFRVVWAILTLIPNVALLSAQRWARIYFSIIYGIILAGVIALMLLASVVIPALVPLLLVPFCIFAGVIFLFLCLLYSTNSNLFFCPEKDPVTFNHYVTIWQLCILLALGSISFGAFRIWEFKTGRIPLPTIATAVDPKAPKPLRTFTNTNGASLRARLIYFDGAQVIIEREDGRRFTNPITIYSSPDQTYIRTESRR